MEKKDLRIVFMGTPDFAVESLRSLVDNGYQVVGVVTTPDKSMGRHRSTLQPSAVKQYAQSVNLPILQPEKLRDAQFLEDLKAWHADVQIVVAFRMLPEVVWEMPPLGTFNLHAALLPQYRGAAPINWAIINGDRETGVTTFFLTPEIDTGRIILQKHVPIQETDDMEAVHDRLMQVGCGAVMETVDLLLQGKVNAIPQEQFMKPDEILRPAPKIFKETCRIHWQQPTKRIYDFIRGLSPYPAAWTMLHEETKDPMELKIFQSEQLIEAHTLPVGTIRTDRKHIDIATEDGFLRLLSLQLSGKKRMSAADFLNGNKQLGGCRVE